MSDEKKTETMRPPPGPGPAKANEPKAAATPELSADEQRKLRQERRAKEREEEAAKFAASLRRYVCTATCPASGATLRNGHEVRLSPGATIELPPESTYTQRLLAHGYIREAEPAADNARRQARKGMS